MVTWVAPATFNFQCTIFGLIKNIKSKSIQCTGLIKSIPVFLAIWRRSKLCHLKYCIVNYEH